MDLSRSDVTRLLQAWGDGDQHALDRLMPVLYSELRKLAASHLRRERPDHTLQATALAHGAFLKLVDQSAVRWQNRAHFFGIAAQMMRRILVDYARAQRAGKRGADQPHVSLQDDMLPAPQRGVDVLALDEALSRLAAIDPQQGRVVELRYFAGLTMAETAEVLGISAATVGRDW